MGKIKNFEYKIAPPDNEIIIQMIEFKGEMFVATNKMIYVLKNNKLDPINKNRPKEIQLDLFDLG